MKEDIWHLIWGVTLFSLYVFLYSIQLPLMAISDALTESQALLLIFAGELVTLLPFSHIIRNNWGLIDLRHWLAFSGLCFLLALHKAASLYCSHIMFLGDFAALVIGSMTFFMPIMTFLFLRRCIYIEEGFSMIAIVIGAMLITQPQFIFGRPEGFTHTPFLGYLLAILCGLPSALICFVIGHFPDVHCSTYMTMRTFFLAIYTAVFLCVTNSWSSLVSEQRDEATNSSLEISIISSVMLGVITNVCQVGCVYGCQELELYSKGGSGIIGSLLNAASIAITALYALIFFDERLSLMQLIGAAVIIASIMLLTGMTVVRKKREVQEDMVRGSEVEKLYNAFNISGRTDS